jgi:hypothetical protein
MKRRAPRRKHKTDILLLDSEVIENQMRSESARSRLIYITGYRLA